MTQVLDQKPEHQFPLINKIKSTRRNKGISLLAAAYILMILVMFILPLFSVPDYSIIHNSLSELGAQFSTNAWIMNFVFVFLALGSIIAGWRYFEGFVLHRIVLVLFGISLALTAFFNHAPVNPDIQYNISEDGWNSYFISSAGLSFIILSIATSFILEKQLDRLLAVAAGISAILLSVLMSEFDWSAGIWQKLQFIISFGWMIYTFKTRDVKSEDETHP
jgi:hypothetical membrane protein